MFGMQADLELARVGGGGAPTAAAGGAAEGMHAHTYTHKLDMIDCELVFPNSHVRRHVHVNILLRAHTHTPHDVGLPKHDVLKSHIARIAELEKELQNVRQFQSLRRQPSKHRGDRSRRSSNMDGE